MPEFLTFANVRRIALFGSGRRHLALARGWAWSYVGQVLEIEGRVDLGRGDAGGPSISCTARKSPDDCNTCEANEWRSTCVRTFAGISVASACAFRRSCSTRGEMRAARA